MSQCSGAIHRTQYVMSDKSDRYSIAHGGFKKQDYDTVCWGERVKVRERPRHELVQGTPTLNQELGVKSEDSP